MTWSAALVQVVWHGALCAALEGAGAAGGDARILVVPDEGQDGPARAEEVYAGLRAAGLLPVSVEERAGVDLPAALEGVPGTKDGARAHLQEARAKLRELDASGAQVAVDAAVEEVIRLDRPDDALDVLADALLFRANLALVEQRADDAHTDLVLLSRLEPSRLELHPGLYPPSLVDAYAAARVEPADVGRATLVVRARAAGFRDTHVLVDARPWDGGALAPGPHLLTVRAEGAAPRSELRNLDASAPAILEPFLAPVGASTRRARFVAAARAAKDARTRTRALEQLATECAARAVVLEHGPALFLFIPGRPLLPLAPSPRDGATVGRQVLAALQPARTPPTDPDLEPGGVSPAVLWAALGGVAGLVVLGAGGGVLTWALWPADPPTQPARPVIITGPTD